jgi:hypothetical protein
VDASDDRQHGRNPAKLEVKITSELGCSVRGTVRDISVAGLFVACADRLPVGTLVALSLEILDESNNGPIKAIGRVAHVLPDGMGVAITDLDLEDYEELHGLVGRALARAGS